MPSARRSEQAPRASRQQLLGLLPLPELLAEHLDEIGLLERREPALHLEQLRSRDDAPQDLEPLRVRRRRPSVPADYGDE